MKPKVIIDEAVAAKVNHFVHKSNYEVSGLGIVRVLDNGTLHVVDTVLLPQKNGSTHTDIEPEDVCKLMYEMRDIEGHLKWWWHSHVDMGVFWSGTDMDTMKKFGAGGWVLSTVFNKKGEKRSAYYSKDSISTPWGQSDLFLDELETIIKKPDDSRIAEWDAEYEANVKVAYTPMTGTSRWWDGSEYNRGWVQEGGVYKREHPTRPAGMSKREWKKLKRMQREIGSTSTDDGPEVDAYGFTQEERAMLAAEGVEDADLDYYAQMHYSKKDVLTLIYGHAGAEALLDGEYDDIPVADRRHLV